MDTSWQIIIGTCAVGALLSIIGLYKVYLRESKESQENQRVAKWSIILSLSGIIFIGIGSIAGIILGILSMKGKKYRTLSKIGIILGGLTLLPWLAVIIAGQ